MAISGVSLTNALLLRDTDQMRFTPSTSDGGTTLITYYAWDQTSGSAGGFANASTRGGTTAFSSASDVITVNVASVNDAPVLDNSGAMTLTTVNEDETTNGGNTVASIIASQVVIALPMSIREQSKALPLQLRPMATDGGSTQPTVEATGPLSARFRTHRRSCFEARTWFALFRMDKTQPLATSPSALGINRVRPQVNKERKLTYRPMAVSTAFSTVTEIASITVTAVNDIPIIAGLDGDVRAYTEDSTPVLIGSTSGITDVDSSDSTRVR